MAIINGQVKNDPSKLSLKEIASQFGICEKSLKRLLSIEHNLTDSMKELLDTGEITKTFTLKSMLYFSSLQGKDEKI